MRLKLIALGVRAYLNEYGPQNEKPLLEATVSQKMIFQCTTCGACEYQCPVGIQHLPMIIGLRRGETDAVALSILTALPNAKVVAFSNDFHRVWIHQMQPHRTEMHDFSLDAMIALLKRLT